MTPTELRRIGEALYGRQWVTAMARDLGISRRTLHRRASGARPIPETMRAELLVIAKRRWQGIEDVL
ncbi:MAG: hypothetical protein C4523_02355 [Myxococcales bacterium]|nr:MAG: hypothetical protein C4523_02355 [Myxococcales bacterium]